MCHNERFAIRYFSVFDPTDFDTGWLMGDPAGLLFARLPCMFEKYRTLDDRSGVNRLTFSRITAYPLSRLIHNKSLYLLSFEYYSFNRQVFTNTLLVVNLSKGNECLS
jgi:hypothetical protein